MPSKVARKGQTGFDLGSVECVRLWPGGLWLLDWSQTLLTRSRTFHFQSHDSVSENSENKIQQEVGREGGGGGSVCECVCVRVLKAVPKTFVSHGLVLTQNLMYWLIIWR